MTLLHALHLAVGIALLLWLAGGGHGRWCARHVVLAGLYWHFVDVLWIFIYPLLHLVGRAGAPA